MTNKTILKNEIEKIKDTLLDLYDKKQFTTKQYFDLQHLLKNKELELLDKPINNKNIIGGKFQKSKIHYKQINISNDIDNQYNFLSLGNSDYSFTINNIKFNSLVNYLTYTMFINLPHKTTELNYFLESLSNNNLPILENLFLNINTKSESIQLETLKLLSDDVYYNLYITNEWKSNYKTTLYNGVYQRIIQNPQLANKLINTKKTPLKDINDINNILGIILIKIRENIINNPHLIQQNISLPKTKNIIVSKNPRN